MEYFRLVVMTVDENFLLKILIEYSCNFEPRVLVITRPVFLKNFFAPYFSIMNKFISYFS